MVKIRKYANGIERFLHGEKGQRFFNFAYSIGAAVVIWGALFKILHLPGGSTLLCIGMGTEIAMFILTAFDRPAKEYAWEEVFPVLDSKNPDDRPDFTGGGPGGMIIGGGGGGTGDISMSGDFAPSDSEGHTGSVGGGGGGGVIIAGGGGGIIGGGVIGGSGVAGSTAGDGESTPGGVVISGGSGIIGGGVIGGLPAASLTEEDATSLHDSIARMAAASEQLSQMAELATATQDYLSQISGIASQMAQLQETTRQLNEVSSVLLDSYRAITVNSETITRSSTGYVDQMENLNRNISGLNTIYEIQLRGISSQLESIDRVNRGLKDIRDMYEKSADESSRYCEETEKMARYMRQLNQVYEKMITAMTVNMASPMMGGMAGANPFVTDRDTDHDTER